MAHDMLQPVSTSSQKDSIWRSVNLPTFRQNVTELKNISKEVPAVKRSHVRLSSKATVSSDAEYTLPFETERVLADGFALIASSQPDVHHVTAATLEEGVSGRLTVRYASNGPIPTSVEENIGRIIHELDGCARRKISREACKKDLFQSIVSTLRQRLHGRLHSKLWDPPRHLQNRAKEPLHSVFKASIGANENAFPGSMRDQASALCTAFESADFYDIGSDEECQNLQHIVLLSHEFCSNPTYRPYLDLAAKSKRLSQIGKIAKYRSLCLQLTDASRRYPLLFQQMTLELLPRYGPIDLPTMPRSSSIKCFVHAEIQLLAFYARSAGLISKKLRAIGVSKSACYLCSLFINQYNQFFVSRTHGKLYDKWTVPDVFNYQPLAPQRENIRHVLVQVNLDVREALIKERQRIKLRKAPRPYPNESDVTLPRNLTLSPLPSVAGTLLSWARSQTPSANDLGDQAQLQLSSPHGILEANQRSRSPDNSIEITEPKQDCSSQLLQHQTSPEADHGYSTALLPAFPSSMPLSRSLPLNGPIASSVVTISAGDAANPTQSRHSAVNLWEFPSHATIMASRPLHTRINGVHLSIELQGGHSTSKGELRSRIFRSLMPRVVISLT
ncbi:MAG: hypothetical protein Q9167_007326 [Letrouitia subvulpina]